MMDIYCRVENFVCEKVEDGWPRVRCNAMKVEVMNAVTFRMRPPC